MLPKMSQKKINIKKIFTRPKSTVNKGNLYEPYNVANIVLNLVSDKNVKNFHISSNDNQYGIFDDIIVSIEFNDQSRVYAIQLKHNDRGQLTKDRLKGEKGDFSINKYYESWKKINCDAQNYILFTNLKFVVEGNIEVCIDGEILTLRPKNVKDEAAKFINTSDSGNCCYRFEVVNKSTNDRFQEFLKKFYLYVSQENLNSLKISTEKKFKEIVSSDEFDKFFKVISKWSIEEGKIEKLDKEWMQNAIAIHSLSSRIKPLSFCEVNENMKILRDSIGMFDLAILEKESSYQTIKEVWGDIKFNIKDIQEVNEVRTKYQLDLNYIKNFQDVDEKLSSLLLWLMGEAPLIVTKDETVEKVIRICERSNFIVIDKNCDWAKSFRNLSDLKEKSSTKLEEILSKFICSLQGKKIPLRELVNEDEKFLELITTDDLLEMLKSTWSIGGGKEILCEPYIDRFLSLNVLDIKLLEDVKDQTLIIDCVENLDDLKKKFPQHNFIDVDEETDNCRYTTGATIYINKKKLNILKFQQLYSKNKQKKCHHFRLVGGNLEWMRSKGGVEDLEKYKIEFFVPEKTLFSSVPENNTNIIIGHPGWGKSELMKSLKNNCQDTFWTVIMSPKDIDQLCQNLQRNVEELIFEIKHQAQKNLFLLLAKKKKIIFVWEALDELSSDRLNEIIAIITDFSKKGYVQWITTRYNLKHFLESKFSVLAITIEKFNEQQQHSYINERLKNKCDSDKIKRVIETLKSTFLIIEHVEILGIPLQLFMLSELFLQDVDGYLEKLTKTFVLTDLYYYFIEEKFKVYFKDKLKTVQISSWKLAGMEYFRVIAVKTLLSESVLKQLDLNYEEHIQKAEDCNLIGIVTVIKSDVRFIHSSFAEYFVALYFADKLDSKMSVLSEFLFDEKYDNVRFFFDLILAKNSKAHVAFLYKNFDLLETYDREILTRKDSGGRTVLHIASSWSQRCPTLPVEKSGQSFIVHDTNVRNLKIENPKFEPIFQHLLEICDSTETDSIFKMNCLSYAQKSNCIFAQIKLMRDQKFIPDDSNKVILLYYSAFFGYEDALDLFNSKPGNSLIHLVTRFVKFVLKLVNFDFSTYIFDTRNENGDTVLFVASQNGHLKIVEFLVERGAAVNAANKEGTTALYLAARKGHLEIVKFLATRGAEINHAANDGTTPLYVASYNGRDQVVKYLLETGAEINRPCEEGFTPLYAASENGYETVVEILVERGAAVNAALQDGRTPLYTATYNGHDCIVKILINHGADINLSNSCGSTLLYIASIKGYERIVRMLIDTGSDVNLSDNNGTTPLYVAAQNGSVEIAKLLLRHGAAVNAALKDGRTPLYVASFNGCYEIVDLLVKAGAKIDSANKDGITPVSAACYQGHSEIVQLLINNGARVNVVDKNGTTPLYIAAYYGHLETAKILVKNGADINVADNDGATPFRVAYEQGHGDVVKFLAAKIAEIISDKYLRSVKFQG